MVSRIPKLAFFLGFYSISLSFSAINNQNATAPFHIGESDAEIRRFLTTSLDRGLPQYEMDYFASLSLTHSHLVVPELTTRIGAALKRTSASDQYIHAMADLLAYCANELAMDALLDLAALEHDRFAYFLRRILDYAQGRRNPYSLVYHALGKADMKVDAVMVSWVEENAPIGNGYRLWSSAIALRNNQLPLNKEELANDPLLMLISNKMDTELHAMSLMEASKNLP